jgi:glutaredoxin
VTEPIPEPVPEPRIEVTVLTQPDCAFCERAAEVLARVGHDHALAVRHLQLDSDEGRALAQRHGVLFAPGVFLDGQLVSYGRLSERRLRRQLARRSPRAEPAGRERGPGQR